MEKLKSFFQEEERYTQEALEVDQEAHQLLHPLFVKWIDEKGYSIRELQHLLSHTVNDLSLSFLLDRPFK